VTSLLRTRGICKRFAGIAALTDVDLDVDQGERVGLVGPNGAGKTTLFNCILGLLQPDLGIVTLDDEDISGLRVHERARRGIARTFQRIELFPDSTVRDHLIIADRTTRRERGWWSTLARGGRPDPAETRRIEEMLELLGLRELADEPIERLSLGQCRLVEVARALMTQPRLVLLDEPSSGLDRREVATLAATLREVQEDRGFAILLVEHDVDLVASFTTRTYLLDFGQMLLTGSTGAVMSSPEMRHAYLGDLEVTA
jgi:branched-chain amino acid transport system ATP-binding protein